MPNEIVFGHTSSYYVCNNCNRLLTLAGVEERKLPAEVSYFIWLCNKCGNEIKIKEIRGT